MRDHAKDEAEAGPTVHSDMRLRRTDSGGWIVEHLGAVSHRNELTAIAAFTSDHDMLAALPGLIGAEVAKSAEPGCSNTFGGEASERADVAASCWPPQNVGAEKTTLTAPVPMSQRGILTRIIDTANEFAVLVKGRNGGRGGKADSDDQIIGAFRQIAADAQTVWQRVPVSMAEAAGVVCPASDEVPRSHPFFNHVLGHLVMEPTAPEHPHPEPVAAKSNDEMLEEIKHNAIEAAARIMGSSSAHSRAHVVEEQLDIAVRAARLRLGMI